MDRARGELAPLLVAVPTTTAEIDRRLMSWSRFQQNAAVSRELTEALGLCRWSTLDDATRRDLAEQLYRLYAITPEEDGTIGLDPLRRIQRIVSMQACAPAAGAAIVAAATTIARTEPQGRSNWW